MFDAHDPLHPLILLLGNLGLAGLVTREHEQFVSDVSDKLMSGQPQAVSKNSERRDRDNANNNPDYRKDRSERVPA